MARLFIAVVTSCALVLTACQTPTNERPLSRHVSGGKLQVRKAPYDGEYRLYASAERRPSARSATPLLNERLVKGELIGFDSDNSGDLVAVVRGEERPLGDAATGLGEYVWTMQPDAGQIDRARTVLLVIGVVAVIGIAVGVAAASAGGSSSTTIAWPL